VQRQKIKYSSDAVHVRIFSCKQRFRARHSLCLFLNPRKLVGRQLHPDGIAADPDPSVAELRPLD
jgi:hypothetical protein